MTKTEIAQRVLDLLDCNTEEMESAIIKLADEIKEDVRFTIENKYHCCD